MLPGWTWAISAWISAENRSRNHGCRNGVRDAGRFELGLPNMAGLVPSAEGIRLVKGLGQSVVLDRISCLAGHCIEGLRDAGIRVRTRSNRATGQVSLRSIPRAHPNSLSTCGRAEWTLAGTTGVWGAWDPHAFNNEEDVERFLAGVQAFQNGQTGT